jgi:hypothetical protein
MTYVETLGGSRATFGRGPISPGKPVGSDPVFSRLAEYEVWERIQARGLGDSHRDSVRLLLDASNGLK